MGGINHYQYAPNPVNWVDPFGLSCKENTWNEFQKDHKGMFSSPSEAAAAYKDLVENMSPWPIGFIPIEEVLPVGTVIHMAFGPSHLQPSTRPGGFASLDAIPNQGCVRNKLAVKDAWKPELDRVVSFELTEELRVKSGPVGPQVDKESGKYLSGGGSQVEMQVAPPERMKYLKIINEEPL